MARDSSVGVSYDHAASSSTRPSGRRSEKYVACPLYGQVVRFPEGSRVPATASRAM